MKNIAVVILAAGKGTRIKAANNRNKVAYKLNGRPIVAYSVDLFKKLGIKNIVVVIGYASQSVKEVLGNQVAYAIQAQQLGTGDALKVGLSQVTNQAKTVISVYGDDSAFYTQELIQALITKHQKQKADITFVTITLDNPVGLGRIIRNKQGRVVAIVEEKNATSKQQQIKEINTGLYCFNKKFLNQAINQIKKNPKSNEYYLTDIIEIAIKQGKKVSTLKWPDKSIWHGINTKEELEKAIAKMQIKSQ